jgi:hypothetical protein
VTRVLSDCLLIIAAVQAQDAVLCVACLFAAVDLSWQYVNRKHQQALAQFAAGVAAMGTRE